MGRDLIIRRFSAPAERIFNLLATDVGRPFRGIRHDLVFSETDGISNAATEDDSSPDREKAPPVSVENLVSVVIDSVTEQEREVRDKDGRCYSLRVRPYMTADNKVDGAVLVLVDISDLKRIEEELKAARDYAQATIQTARDPLLILRNDLRVNTANEAFYKTFQTSPDQTEGRLIYELGNGQWNIPQLRVLLERILPQSDLFNDFEVTWDFPAIGRRTMLLNARRLRQDRRASQMILLAIEDVTDRQRADLAIAAAAAIVDSSHDAIIGMDLNGLLTSWNRGAERLFGYTAAEAIGRSVEMLIPDDRPAEESQILARLRRGERLENFETVRLRKNGTPMDVSLTVSPMTNSAGEVVGASKIARDITERKRAAERLADRAGRLEQAVIERTAELTAMNKQLEAFVYSIAHDLRAPLRSMQGFSSLLVEEAGAALSDLGQNYAQRINKSAQMMDAMLTDLLGFSRVSQQRIELSSVSLEAILESTLAGLQPDIQETSARVENAGPWPSVLGHEATLAQIMVNLVSNALKFVPPNTPPVIRLRTEEQAEFVRVWVEDNGIGIAPDHQDQIFRLFVRLRGDKYPGTGIGLAIVRKGIERMGGQAGVESAPDEGSRFWFELRKASNAL